MAKRDPNGPTARLEEVHRLLCRGTGKMATMMAVRQMDVPTIVEISDDVQRAAAAMKDFAEYMVELKQRQLAAQRETENEIGVHNGGGDCSGDADRGGGGDQLAGGAAPSGVLDLHSDAPRKRTGRSKSKSSGA